MARVGAAVLGTLLCATAAGALAIGDYAMGLDFEGGGVLRIGVAAGAERGGDPFAAVATRLHRLDVEEPSLYRSGDEATLMLPRVSAAQLDAVARELTGTAMVELRPSGSAMDPVVTTRDVAGAEVEVVDGRPVVMLELTPEAGERLHEHTRRFTGQTLAIVVDGRTVSEPRIEGPIPGGRVRIDLGPEPGDPARAFERSQELASRLAAAGIPLEVRSIQHIDSTYPPVLGRPLAVAVAILAALAWLAALRAPRALAPAAAALTVIPLAQTILLVVLDGTFASSIWPGAAAGAVPVAVTVALAHRAGWRTAWPALAPLAALLFAAAVVYALVPGFWRGASITTLIALLASPVPIGLGWWLVLSP